MNIEQRIMKRVERKNYYFSFNTIVLIGIILLVSCFIINQQVEANINSGFSIELIHRDSPLLNSNLSHYERQKNASERIESSQLAYDDGLYLMKIWYGTPPVELYQLLDTDSDISWIQCLPCTHCFSSRYQPFNPNTSRTFVLEKCHVNQTCPYSLEYGGNSTTIGVLARETIMVGTSQSVPIKNFIFGCGHENRGFFPHNSAGIIGFSPKEKSFITQLASKHHGKFSMCLTTPSSAQPGRISFGDEANVSGSNVITTSLILDSHYNVILDAITVGVKKIKNSWNQYENTKEDNVGVENKKGKMAVDSGANVIYLSDSMYSKVEKWVRKQIKKQPAPKSAKALLCYIGRLGDNEIPKITLHFPGADLELSPLHTFIGNSSHRCLAITTTTHKPVLGSMAMTNFLVGFDLVKKKISFKPINCSRSYL